MPMATKEEALKMMKEEGLENIFQRHEKHKLAVCNAMQALNLKLFAKSNSLSPSITAIESTQIHAEEFRKIIKDKYDILLAGGQDGLKGKIFRVGHLGYINDRDIMVAISAIGLTLLENKLISTEQLGKALQVAKTHLQ